MQLFLTMEDKLYEGNCMLIKAIKNQTIFLLKQKEASLTFILLLAVVLGNYITNVLTFRGTDVSQMYQPMKLLALSLNKVYFSANIQLLIVMIYPILVAVPASKGGLIGTMRGISEYDSLASIKALYDAASDVDLFYSKECQKW